MGGKEVSESGERANDTLLLIIQRIKREDESPEFEDMDTLSDLIIHVCTL